MKLILLFLSLLLAASGWAQTPNIPIQDVREIAGCWERIDFSEKVKKQMNEIEPWRARYQWFCFEADGTLLSYMSSEPAVMTAAQLRGLFKALPKVFKYSLLPQSVIKTEGRAGKETLPWPAAFLGASRSFDNKVIEKGTLIMSLFDSDKGRPVYWRYLKRVE